MHENRSIEVAEGEGRLSVCGSYMCRGTGGGKVVGSEKLKVCYKPQKL